MLIDIIYNKLIFTHMRIMFVSNEDKIQNIVCLWTGIFWVSNYDSMCIEWKGRAFNRTTEEGIFVGGEVGFIVGACIKHKQQ